METVESGESILDVGCGPGCVYENLIAQAKHDQVKYRGLDYSISFIDACLNLFPGVDFRLGDARALMEEDSSWDTVLLCHVLEHCPGYRQPIYEAMRVARGRVVIIMWRPLYAGPDKVEDKGGDTYCCDYNEAEFLSFLDSLEFPIERFEFPGQRKNWAWVISKEENGRGENER